MDSALPAARLSLDMTLNIRANLFTALFPVGNGVYAINAIRAIAIVLAVPCQAVAALIAGKAATASSIRKIA